MATTRAALTDADIRTLVRGATEDERAAAALKLCRRVDGRLSEEDRQAAREIIRLMSRDAAERVRRALATTLRASPLVPRDVALRLAQDVDAVALPVLHHSPVFTDADLADIVRATNAARQVAVARRTALGETVTAALVEHACEEAVRIACANDNALFSEASLEAACDRFADSEAVTAAIAFRKVLPLSIAEKLAQLASEEVRQHLLDRKALSAQTALQIAVGALERATVDLVDQAGRIGDLGAFCAHLHAQARLTPSLLLRAAAHGQMSFFEAALSELSGVPHHRTWLMVHDAGALGLRAICDKAELPPRLFPAFRAAVDAYHVLQADGEARDPATFQERMLQRFLTQPYAAGREDIDYLLERLDRLGERARAAGRGALRGAA